MLKHGAFGGKTMVNIEEIKERFNEEYPDAAKAIKENRMPDKTHAFAMYHAFKRGYINGSKGGSDSSHD